LHAGGVHARRVAGAEEREVTRWMIGAALFASVALANAATPVMKPVMTDNNASCDIATMPAATLLLPYFEVDFHSTSANAVNTVFTIVNTSRTPQIARITIWTDWGFPVTWFSSFLTGYDAQTISLYEVIARGSVPATTSISGGGALSAANNTNPRFLEEIWCEHTGGSVSREVIQRLQKMLTTGERDNAACRVGGQHENAIGYVTVDVVNSCAIDSPLEESYWNSVILYDNVLTGDYERVNPNAENGNYAGGSPLVHIRAVPDGGSAGQQAATSLPYTFYDRYLPASAKKLDRRQPLPSTFAARWIEGGTTGFRTNLTIWREGIVGATKNECEYAKNATLPVNRSAIVRFDEQDNATVVSCGETLCSGSLPVVSSTSAASGAIFPPLVTNQDIGGWLWLSLDNRIPGSETTAYGTPRASQNWVTVSMYAEGRYAVDFDATALANGCGAPAAVPRVHAAPAAPRP
jgi:hypothetical protein